MTVFFSPFLKRVNKSRKTKNKKTTKKNMETRNIILIIMVTVKGLKGASLCDKDYFRFFLLILLILVCGFGCDNYFVMGVIERVIIIQVFFGLQLRHFIMKETNVLWTFLMKWYALAKMHFFLCKGVPFARLKKKQH